MDYRPHSPRNRGYGRKKRSPLPAILVGATLLVLVALGVVACNRQKELPPASSSESSTESVPASSGSSESTLPESSESSPSAPESSISAAEPVDSDDWRLVLVNPKHKLQGDYDVTLANVNASYQLDERVVEDMKAMLAAAKKDGYTLQICSAYRSTERSAILYQNKINEFKNAGYAQAEAATEAAKWVAPPGTSEHNTGLAADIVSGDYFTKYADLEHDFENFDEFKWLYTHCAEYGFILRYPKEKQEITGITYEPWHYRYVGQENAKKIMEQKLCLEEYLAK